MHTTTQSHQLPKCMAQPPHVGAHLIRFFPRSPGAEPCGASSQVAVALAAPPKVPLRIVRAPSTMLASADL